MLRTGRERGQGGCTGSRDSLRVCTGNLGTKGRSSLAEEASFPKETEEAADAAAHGFGIGSTTSHLSPSPIGDPQPLKSLLDLSDSLIQVGLLAQANIREGGGRLVWKPELAERGGLSRVKVCSRAYQVGPDEGQGHQATQTEP